MSSNARSAPSRADGLLSRLLCAVALIGASAFGTVACGGANAGAGGGTEPGSANAAAPKEGADAGAADAAAERPFAGSAAEATQLIGATIDKYNPAINKCVREYRARKNLPHERVELSVGIDQHGRVLGVTLKKKPDAELSSCVQDTLKSALFPRSNTGVITITKSYEEIVQ